jgi:hypothetical protein
VTRLLAEVLTEGDPEEVREGDEEGLVEEAAMTADGEGEREHEGDPDDDEQGDAERIEAGAEAVGEEIAREEPTA